ncbi:OsmC family protein [Nocardioides dokdonensis]|nr:OsmC family protein [Nocardioides dokdonensis]
MSESTPEASPDTLRSIDLVKIGPERFKATNGRGGVLPIGSGSDPDFTPVELLLAALAGCGAIDLTLITGKRAEATGFSAHAEGHKIRDEAGSRMTGMSITFDIDFPEGEAGDAARAVVPRTMKQIEDRLCTVGRTVIVGDQVRYRVADQD